MLRSRGAHTSAFSSALPSASSSGAIQCTVPIASTLLCLRFLERCQAEVTNLPRKQTRTVKKRRETEPARTP